MVVMSRGNTVVLSVIVSVVIVSTNPEIGLSPGLCTRGGETCAPFVLNIPKGMFSSSRGLPDSFYCIMIIGFFKEVKNVGISFFFSLQLIVICP